MVREKTTGVNEVSVCSISDKKLIYTFNFIQEELSKDWEERLPWYEEHKSDRPGCVWVHDSFRCHSIGQDGDHEDDKEGHEVHHLKQAGGTLEVSSETSD